MTLDQLEEVAGGPVTVEEATRILSSMQLGAERDGRGSRDHTDGNIGRSNTLGNNYRVKQIWDEHREMIRRLSIGDKPKDIAKAMGVTRQTVTRIRHCDTTRERIDELHAAMDGEVIDIGRRIRAFAPIALAIREEMCLDEDTPTVIREKISSDFLDRAGYAAPKVVNVENRFGLSQDTLALVRTRAHQLGLASVQAEDAIITEVISETVQ